jgi:hypothetical protein
MNREIYGDEYCYYIISGGKSHTPSPRFVHRNDLCTGFSSLYAVTQETADAIKDSGTTARFQGTVWSPTLAIDTDTEEAAREVEQRLKELGLEYSVYSTGNRGLHFYITRPASPSHLLPLRDKAWVQSNFPEADTSIYTHLHLFRLPDTVHENTGRPKELLREVPGKPLDLPVYRVKELGNIPAESSGELSVFECTKVMANTVPVNNGQRHPTLVRLCYALKDDAGVSAAIALWWLGETNKMFEEPRTQEHLEQIVRSIYG